jgi:hypothetical protein
MSDGVYLEDWAASGEAGMFEDFSVPQEEREKIKAEFEVIHAFYSYANYSGEAFVVLRSRADGEFWEVNGGHCSCHGLEGQWEMESTTLEALAQRHQARQLPGMGDGDIRRLAALVEAKELGEEILAPMARAARKTI